MSTIAAIHLLAACVFLLLDIPGKPRPRAISEAVIVLCVPVFGITILVVFKLLAHICGLYGERTPELPERGEAFFLGREAARDAIPLNDAFLVEDETRKRGLFTEAIKQEVVDNQKILQMAMHDPDPEVAYYAVSMLTSKMENLESEIFRQASENEDDPERLKEYAGLLEEYLSMKEFTDSVTWEKKRHDYADVLGKLVDMIPDDMDIHEKWCKVLKDMKDPHAETACHIFQQHFTGMEQPLLAYAALYGARRDIMGVRRVVDALKALPTELSPEALRVIRFWDRRTAENG